MSRGNGEGLCSGDKVMQIRNNYDKEFSWISAGLPDISDVQVIIIIFDGREIVYIMASG
jgi:hypothetical protein